ncbi:MAG: choice-of-anchor D domain-containing protein [Candidatus Marinimicrobia bacterium]|nr:choice-of-anchor D domain-containing protein [Candidatus Neomarinimicrobiota bacterium]MBL7010459.1 choice-of-anchor D domain-containing protein [Candidatus Neomarinimicrobiota bacterium]MBL7030982.1 choice-of-anchor D domain-containing protein [Candidatus Neomarinimicrobiota bacterium]
MNLRKILFSGISFMLVMFACEDKVDPNYEIIFEPTELQFGKVEANQIVSQKVRVKNSENSTGTFTGEVQIMDSPKFTMDFNGVLTLQKNESKEIFITFRPSSVESYSAKLTVSNDDSFAEMYMNGEGVSPVSFTYSPNALEFGLVEEGGHKDMDLTITNNADSGFDLEIDFSVASSEFSFVDGVTSHVIPPGQSQAIPIRYSPTTTSISKHLVINHNSSVKTNPMKVTLSGIMDKTTDIISAISDGWDAFENSDYSGSASKFQVAITFANTHESYDSLNAEATVGRGWASTFQRNYFGGYYDFSTALEKYNTSISDGTRLDALAGKAITGRLVNSYGGSIEAALDLLTRKADYQFSHKTSVDYKDVRMALIQSYFNTGMFTEAASEMDLLDSANAPHSADPAVLLAAIQVLSGSL